MAMPGTIERGKDKGHAAGAIDAERRRRQRMRNWAVLAALVAFCVVVYAITMVKLTGG
jgi:hypothetical protein